MPGSLRTALAAIVALAPVGVALVVVAGLEMLWWRSPDAAQLQAVFGAVQEKHGLEPPFVLRNTLGSLILIGLGLIGAALALFAVPMRAGRQWARTTVVWTLSVVLLIGLIEIGADATITSSPATYLTDLARYDPDGVSFDPGHIRSLLYPAWYTWVEDLAQGAQVIAALGVLLSLAKAALWHETLTPSAEPGEGDDDMARFLAKVRAERQ